jgi:Ca-activated chloride channel family protein
MLTGVDVKIDGVTVRDMFPRPLPDLFAGRDIRLLGLNTTSGKAKVTLTGELAGKPWTQSYDLEFPARTDTANASIEGLWASRKVGFLLDEIRRNGETPELKDEVVALAEKHRLVTPYTSFLVREDDAPGTPVVAGASRGQNADEATGLFFAREAAPSTAPASAGAFGVDATASTTSRGDIARARQEAAKDIRAQSGEGAVSMARDISELKKAEAPMDSKQTASRRIGERRLEFGAGKWMQVADGLDKLPTVQVKYLSDAWFALHDKYEEIREILKLGEVVEFEFKGSLIKIGAEGIEEVSGLPEALLK